MTRPKLCYVELLLTCGLLVTLLATEIRQKQHSDLAKMFISLSSDFEVLYGAQLHRSCHTGSGAGGSPVQMMTIFSRIQVFNGLPSESLDDFAFDSQVSRQTLGCGPTP